MKFSPRVDLLLYCLLSSLAYSVSSEYNPPPETILKTNILQFLKVVNGNETDFLLSGIKNQLSVDLAVSQQINIYLGRLSKVPDINIYAWVHMLDDKANILTYSLCKKVKMNEDAICASNKADIEAKFKMNILHWGHYGLNISVNWSDTSVDHSGFYYIEYTNYFGSITSNYISVIDVRFQLFEELKSTDKAPNKVELAEICTNNLPILLKCVDKISFSDEPVRHEFYPFEWETCTEKAGVDPFETAKCLDRDTPEVVFSGMTISNMDFEMLPDGSLVILKIKNAPDHNKASLQCTSVAKTAQRIFVGKLVDNSKHYAISFQQCSPGPSNDIEALWPTDFSSTTFVKLRAGSILSRKLRAFYRTTQLVSWQWFKNGEKLDDPNFATSDRYFLEFKNAVSQEHEGKYTLRLNNGEKEFHFEVKVVDYPRFSNAVPVEVFVMNGSTVSIVYNFTMSDSRKHLFIDGKAVSNLNDETEMNRRLRNRNLKFTYFDVSFQSSDSLLQTASSVTYTAKNLQRKTEMEIDSTHTVTLAVENDHGQSQTYTIIRVLPVPTLERENPSTTGCQARGCSPNGGHTFQCGFPVNVYVKEGAVAKHIWFLNGHRINLDPVKSNNQTNSSVDDYFTVKNNDYNKIILEEIPDIEKRINNANLTCRFIILRPDALEGDSIEDWYIKEQVIFDSFRDFADNAKLSTIIRFERPFNMADLTWLYILLAALVLVAIVVTIVVFKLTRPPKETYHVEKEEQAHGNDPKMESRDQGFHVYVRGEHDSEFNDKPKPHNPLMGDESYGGVLTDEYELLDTEEDNETMSRYSSTRVPTVNRHPRTSDFSDL